MLVSVSAVALIGGNKIKYLQQPLQVITCAGAVASCGRTRLIVCFDFVKLVSELEIRPERLPSTLPHTRAVFLARGPRR